MGNRTLAGVIAIWEQLLAGAEANCEDLLAVEAIRAQLFAEMTDLKAVHSRRQTLRAEARQATRDLHLFLARGRDLAERLRSGVRLLYGPRSAKLTEFGIKTGRYREPYKAKDRPRRDRRRSPPKNTATGK